MRLRTSLVLLLGLLAWAGCSRKKTTDELLKDLKSSDARDKIIAVRLLPQRTGDAAKVVPALTEALKDKSDDVRRSAAIGLGDFGDQARDAVPALQALAQRDSDPRVREAAGYSLGRIDPSLAPKNTGKRRGI
jgi:HEAT repeat protein